MRLIDKDALLKELGISDEECEKCDRGDRNGYCAMSSDWTYACDAICTAPTIEERKTGKWIQDPHSKRYRCDQCLSAALKTDDGQENLSDFCPVCGAKMEGDQP